MGNVIGRVIIGWEILCKACIWILSKITRFLNYISEEANNLVNQAKRFYDNVSEGLKDSIAKAKRAIDEKLEKISNLMRLKKEKLSSIISTTVEEAKKRVIQIKNLVVSMLERTLDLVTRGIVSSFVYLMKHASRITRKIFDFGFLIKENIFDEYDDLKCVWFLAQGLWQLINIVITKPCRVPYVICEACYVFGKEPSMKGNIEETRKFEKTCFKMLKREERKAAVFVYFALQLAASFVF